MRFGNRTTGGRLALGFGGLMTVMLMLIGLAVWNMAQIDGQLDKILGDNLRSSQLLNDMSEAAHTETTELRNLLLLSNSEREVVTNAQHVAAERKKYHEAHAILEKMPAATEDLALRKATDAAALAARRVNDEIIQLARTHHTSEALELLRTQGGAVTAAWQTALDAEIEHQKQENAKAGTQAHQQYVRTISILGLTVFAGLLMAFFIARTTTRSVTLPVAQAMEAAERIAGGDLGRPIHTRSADELGRMLAALEKMRLGPAHSVTEIRMAAENVSSASREIAKGNTGLSTRTEEQASSIEETAASMEQISTTVKQNSESAEKANHLANAAADVATRGGGAVTKVVATMRNISESSKKIGDIVGVIDSLAFQTNILSLNAAVEAARAGEQGRGFAVVASEVRALAQRSAQAAKEIRALILESAQRVEDGVKQVESAGATMNEIVTAVGSVSTLITEIAHGSREQLAGIGQVNQAIMQIDGNTQESAAVVEEAAAAAEHLAGQAELLVTAVARFRLDGVEHESAAPATAEPQQRSGGLPGSLQRVASRLGVASPAALPLAAAAKSGEASWKEF